MSTSPPVLPITLVLADDHAIVRMGFRLLLEGVGARVLAEAEPYFQFFPRNPGDAELSR